MYVLFSCLYLSFSVTDDVYQKYCGCCHNRVVDRLVQVHPAVVEHGRINSDTIDV